MHKACRNILRKEESVEERRVIVGRMEREEKMLMGNEVDIFQCQPHYQVNFEKYQPHLKTNHVILNQTT